MTKEEVYEIAKENVERLLPVEIKYMTGILSDMLEDDIEDVMYEESPIPYESLCRFLRGFILI